MLARHIPYAVGAFMLVPLGLWLGLWFFAFPGPKQGLGGPLSVAMGFVSLPLVAWFYICTLGMLSNSIERRDEFERPRHYWLDHLITALPWIAMATGAGAAPYLLLTGTAWPLSLLPLGLSAVIAGAIVAGERARGRDRQSLASAQRTAPTSVETLLKTAGGLAMSAVFAVPILGRMLREAVDNGSRGWTYLSVNLVLASIVAVAFFGYPALITIALMACAVVFVMMLTIAAG